MGWKKGSRKVNRGFVFPRFRGKPKSMFCFKKKKKKERDGLEGLRNRKKKKKKGVDTIEGKTIEN